jgi:hypothetical protein
MLPLQFASGGVEELLLDDSELLLELFTLEETALLLGKLLTLDDIALLDEGRRLLDDTLLDMRELELELLLRDELTALEETLLLEALEGVRPTHLVPLR